MKKIIYLFLLVPFGLLAQTNSSFTINGKLEGYADGTTIRLVRNGESTDMAAGTIKKSVFQLNGTLAEPVLCFLFIGNEPKPVEVFVENKIISLSVDKSRPGEFKIEGSDAHKEFDNFVKEFIPLAQQLSSLATVVNNTMPGPERDSLMVTHKNMQNAVQKSIDKLLLEKPKSIVTAFVLSATYAFNENPQQLEERYNKLHPSIQGSEAGQQIAATIADSKIGAIGTVATDFTQADTSGVPVSLISFRGKYVLVDFWASWCGPCRDENPNVVQNFKKFNPKNFTVLGVSLDRPGQKARWVDAIHEDNLTWTHVSDLQFWNNAVARLYRIQSIPQNYLIDPEGKIIAKNLRGQALEAKLCEILGCN